MALFFKVPSSTNLTKENADSVHQYLTINQTPFGPKDTNHRRLVKSCNDELSTKLKALKTIDTHIVVGLLTGVVALALSTLFPLSGVSFAGFAYCAYCCGKRAQLARDYHDALENAVGALEWTLSNVDWGMVEGKPTGVKQCAVVQNLFNTLSPLLSKDQLKKILDKRIEEAYSSQASSHNKDIHISILKRPLNEEERNLLHGVYGYKQGGIQHVGLGLWRLACQLLGKLKDAIVGKVNPKPAAAATAPKPADDIAPVVIRAAMM